MGHRMKHKSGLRMNHGARVGDIYVYFTVVDIKDNRVYIDLHTDSGAQKVVEVGDSFGIEVPLYVRD